MKRHYVTYSLLIPSFGSIYEYCSTMISPSGIDALNSLTVRLSSHCTVSQLKKRFKRDSQCNADAIQNTWSRWLSVFQWARFSTWFDCRRHSFLKRLAERHPASVESSPTMLPSPESSPVDSESDALFGHESMRFGSGRPEWKTGSTILVQYQLTDSSTCVRLRTHHS